MIIGLSGKKQSGKDTSAKLLQQLLVQRGYKVSIESFASTLKQMAGILLDMNYHDFESEKVKSSPAAPFLPEEVTVRSVLQLLGTEIGHQLGASIWVDKLMYRIKAMQEADPSLIVIITDVRFPTEAGKILISGGTLIRLEVPGQDNTDQHPSETALDGYSFKYVIVNQKKEYSELKGALETIVSKEFTSYGIPDQC